VIVCDADIFSLDESWLIHASTIQKPLSVEVLNQEKELIEAALAQSRGRVSGASGAAVMLKMPPSTLDSKIRVLKIDKRSFQL
jgi:formate hydrogenlyase transcriptional activator